MKFILFLTNVNIFNKTFSSSKLHKGVNIKILISKLKNQSSATKTISGSVDGNSFTCCMSKVFKKFPSGLERLRHVDVTMTLTSSGVVIRGLPGGGLSFLLPGLFITSKTAWHVSNTCTCFNKSKRGNSVIC